MGSQVNEKKEKETRERKEKETEKEVRSLDEWILSKLG
jgi:hypothetical protein